MMIIDHRNLAKLDLNLLVALDTLLREQSVTRAARIIGLGQSAMSHNLARLRALFDDELLTRGPHGMRRTPRAEMLLGQLQAVLLNVQSLVNCQSNFDPRTAERNFRIALPDSIEVLLVPKLLSFLAEFAPKVRLRLHTVDPATVLEELDANRIDFGVGIGPFGASQNHHRSRVLFNDTYLCIFNSELTGIQGPITMEDYLRLPHILTSLRYGEYGVVDAALAELGLSRRIALTTSRFMSVPILVAQAPVIATMHAIPARLLADTFGLCLSPPPVALSAVSISLLWHASYDHDIGHKWLRQHLVHLTSDLLKDVAITAGHLEKPPQIG